jgi:hypothetical protein
VRSRKVKVKVEGNKMIFKGKDLVMSEKLDTRPCKHHVGVMKTGQGVHNGSSQWYNILTTENCPRRKSV